MKLKLLLTLALASFLLTSTRAADYVPQVGLQTWTCRNMSFEEMVAFAEKHGLTVEFIQAPAFDQLTAPVGPPLLIHGGMVVNADTQVTADVLMENGIIIAIGSNLLAPPNAIKIDASGK